MKKLLAILMTVAMIVGVFTFGVSAAGETQSICAYCNKYHPVGARCAKRNSPRGEFLKALLVGVFQP